MREIFLIATVLSFCWLVPPLARQGWSAAVHVLGLASQSLQSWDTRVGFSGAIQQLDLPQFELLYRAVWRILDVSHRAVHVYRLANPSEETASDNHEPSHSQAVSRAQAFSSGFARLVFKIVQSGQTPASVWGRVRSARLRASRPVLHLSLILAVCKSVARNVTLTIRSAALWLACWPFCYVLLVHRGSGLSERRCSIMKHRYHVKETGPGVAGGDVRAVS